MASTTTYSHGDVIVVEVFFTGRPGGKPRPALVVSTDAFHKTLADVLICPISSQPRYHEKPGPGDVPLKHWSAIGLRHPSTACVSNLTAVDKALIKRKLARLPAADLERVEQCLAAALGFDPAGPRR